MKLPTVFEQHRTFVHLCHDLALDREPTRAAEMWAETSRYGTVEGVIECPDHGTAVADDDGTAERTTTKPSDERR